MSSITGKFTDSVRRVNTTLHTSFKKVPIVSNNTEVYDKNTSNINIFSNKTPIKVSGSKPKIDDNTSTLQAPQIKAKAVKIEKGKNGINIKMGNDKMELNDNKINEGISNKVLQSHTDYELAVEKVNTVQHEDQNFVFLGPDVGISDIMESKITTPDKLMATNE